MRRLTCILQVKRRIGASGGGCEARRRRGGRPCRSPRLDRGADAARDRTRRRSPRRSARPGCAPSGMSPSPGTSRCDVRGVPTLKSLTCTSADAIDRRRGSSCSRPRSAQHALSSMHTPMSSGAPGRSRRCNVCTNPTSTRNELVCSMRERNPASLRLRERPARARPRAASAASSQVERRERSGREHDAFGAPTAAAVSIECTSGACCFGPTRRVGEFERTEPDQVGDRAGHRADRVDHELACPRPIRSVRAWRPTRRPYAMPWRAQNSRSSSSARPNVEMR